MYGVIGAYFDAIAEADASVNAVLGSSEKLSCHFAGFHTAVSQLFASVMCIALAKHHSSRRQYFTCRKAGQFGYFF